MTPDTMTPRDTSYSSSSKKGEKQGARKKCPPIGKAGHGDIAQDQPAYVTIPAQLATKVIL